MNASPPRSGEHGSQEHDPRERAAHDTDTGERIDALARRLHTESLGTLTARTQAQLHQRRRAALRGEAARRPSWLWPTAAVAGTAAVAVAVALAIGMQIMRPQPTEPAAPIAAGRGATPAPPTTALDREDASTAQQAVADANTQRVDTGTDTATGPAVDTTKPAVDDVDALIAAVDAPGSTDASTQLPEPPDAEALDAELFAALEETPDFYLWLGSEEAEASLSEAL